METHYTLKELPHPTDAPARFEITEDGQGAPQMKGYAEQPDPNGNYYLHIEFLVSGEGEKPHYGHFMPTFGENPTQTTQRLHASLVELAKKKLLDPNAEEDIVLEDLTTNESFTNHQLS